MPNRLTPDFDHQPTPEKHTIRQIKKSLNTLSEIFQGILSNPQYLNQEKTEIDTLLNLIATNQPHVPNRKVKAKITILITTIKSLENTTSQNQKTKQVAEIIKLLSGINPATPPQPDDTTSQNEIPQALNLPNQTIKDLQEEIRRLKSTITKQTYTLEIKRTISNNIHPFDPQGFFFLLGVNVQETLPSLFRDFAHHDPVSKSIQITMSAITDFLNSRLNNFQQWKNQRITEYQQAPDQTQNKPSAYWNLYEQYVHKAYQFLSNPQNFYDYTVGPLHICQTFAQQLQAQIHTTSNTQDQSGVKTYSLPSVTAPPINSSTTRGEIITPSMSYPIAQISPNPNSHSGNRQPITTPSHQFGAITAHLTTPKKKIN